MAFLFFPDNTVLVNFGIIDRFDVLSRLASGNGRWCGTVAAECDDSAHFWPAMSNAADIFGQPLLPSQAEHIDTRILRTRMAAPGDESHKHLGEAETITIITSRGWARQSYFVTDDSGAASFASRDGVRVVSTWDLLRLAFRAKLMSEEETRTAVESLGAERRGRPPCGAGRAAFVAWLQHRL